MKDAKELTPGVLLVGRDLRFCPGCGAEDAGLDPADPRDILDWCKGTFAALEELGVQGCSEKEAEELAARYMKEPWHAT